jgi:RHS repeat-associated protein
VLVTVSDKKLAVDSDNDGVINYYNADVVTAGDYYPFGSQMPGRKYSQPNSSYRYGFNGQENSDEIAAGLTTAMYWEYDSRIGKRWNIDPVLRVWESPYSCFSNNPILQNDPDGDEPDKPTSKGTVEGEVRVTKETKYPNTSTGNCNECPNGDPGSGSTTEKTWNWHAGGVDMGNAGKTEAGWYSNAAYQAILTPLANELVATTTDDINLMLSGPARAGGYQSGELGKFLAKGVTLNALSHLYFGAQNVAKEANFRVSGVIYASGFNVEDMLGFGMLMKQGIKMLASASAKNIANIGIGSIRNVLGIGKKKNIATLGGMVEGKGVYTIGVSGAAVREGTVGVPILRRFTTAEVGGYDRILDSEVKVLEDFAEKFHKTPNVKGIITLTSERPFCTSCTGVTKQFEKMFPNIQLNLINGTK